MALVYCCSLDGLIASIVLICTSLWIKASAKLLNVNVHVHSFFLFFCIVIRIRINLN